MDTTGAISDSLQLRPFSKKELFLKQRICSQRERILSFKKILMVWKITFTTLVGLPWMLLFLILHTCNGSLSFWIESVECANFLDLEYKLSVQQKYSDQTQQIWIQVYAIKKGSHGDLSKLGVRFMSNLQVWTTCTKIIHWKQDIPKWNDAACSISPWVYTNDTRDVRNELLIVLYLDIPWGTIKTNKYLSRFIQGLHNGV